VGCGLYAQVRRGNSDQQKIGTRPSFWFSSNIVVIERLLGVEEACIELGVCNHARRGPLVFGVLVYVV